MKSLLHRGHLQWLLEPAGPFGVCWDESELCTYTGYTDAAR